MLYHLGGPTEIGPHSRSSLSQVGKYISRVTNRLVHPLRDDDSEKTELKISSLRHSLSYFPTLLLI